MAVIQTIDNYWNNLALQFFNKKLFQCKYKENIEKYFGKYKNHETITVHHKLCNNVQDISTFINCVLCYSDPPEFYTIANPKNNLRSVDIQCTCEEFINGLKQFYKDTDFEYFFENNQNEYENILNDYEDRNEVVNYVDIVNTYLDTDIEHYTIIISALLRGCFGIKIQTNENSTLNYSVLSPYDYKDNKYVFGPKNVVKEYIWHEISHLTINDLTKNYLDRFNVNGKIISEDFIKHFYTDIESIVNEYIIRAITIRLFEINHEEKFMEYLLQDNIEKGFKEIESIKNYISKNCETNNKLIKNEKYQALINYVIDLF
jgi:hypothetical protein